MRLYSGRIPAVAEQVIAQLVAEDDIEVLAEELEEAQMDVEAILREYLRTEREIEELARDMLAARGLSHTGFGKIKRQIADGRKFGLGEDAIGWIVDQLLAMFMHTTHVEEIYADDLVLRKKIATVLRKHMAEDEDLDREVRKRLRNLDEGTVAWDTEYDKVEENLKRLKNLI